MLLELPKDKKQEKIWTFKTIVCITQTGFAQWVTIGKSMIVQCTTYNY